MKFIKVAKSGWDTKQLFAVYNDEVLNEDSTLKFTY